MNDSEPVESRPPRVFISYSHDNREHCDRVLGLAQQLRRDGIDVELDQFHQFELVHWSRWYEEQLRPENSDFVLCVCTAEYKKRIEGKVAADVGKGVFWEGALIYNYLYDDKGNSRCVPVYLADEDAGEIPAILKGYPRFHLNKFALDDPASDYVQLYRLLNKQPSGEKVDIGEIRKRPPLTQGEPQTDFAQLVEQISASIVDVESDTRAILSILKDRTPPQSTAARPNNLPPWMAPDIFIGRAKELTTLCDGLVAQNSSAVVQPQVVIGEGGIGKTRLAVQVLWLLYLQGKCDMAFYVSASSTSELDTQLAGLSGKSLLNLYEETEPPRELDARRQDVIDALREKVGRWVMLLDAADSQDARIATNRLLNELAGGSFLITSRHRDWPKGIVSTVELNLFTPAEARECLRSRYWKKEPSAQELADFDRLAEELGRLPLALALSASYMESQSIPPARYLVAWKGKHDALLKFSGDDFDSGRSLLGTFQLSYDRLNAAAAALLRLFAWLAPEPFPRNLVEDSERVKDILSANQKNLENYHVTDALAQLRALSLIRLDEESLQCPKLVLGCTQALLSGELRRESLATTLEWISGSLPQVDYNEAGWNLWKRLAPHLDVVIENGERYNMENQALSLLRNQYGLWVYYQARYEMAEPLMRRALAIDERSLGADHPNVARDLSNLAQLLKDTNRLAEAEPLMRRALAIDEKSLWGGSSGRGQRPQQSRSIVAGHESIGGGGAVDASGVGDR